jgi:hypothetical protein
MLALLGFIRTPKALLSIAVVLAFVSLAGLVYVRGKNIEVLEAQKKELSAKLESVGATLASQNEAVESLKKASDAQTERAAKAAKAAERAIGAANARAAALALVQVPAACPDALEWLRLEAVKTAPAQERSK